MYPMNNQKRRFPRAGSQAPARPAFVPPALPSAQQKLISVNDQLGMPGVATQQGSTIVKYDTLPLATGNIDRPPFMFFKNAKNRTLPFTNMEDNKLTVAESLVIERVYFFVITQETATGEFSNVQDLDAFGQPGSAISNLQIQIGNDIVMKQTPLLSFKPQFNKSAAFANYNVFHMQTLLTIPPGIEFNFALQLPKLNIPSSDTNTYYIGCSIEGPGSIFAPKINY